METFDLEVMRKLETLPHAEALSVSLELLKTSKTKAHKKAALMRDIEKAPSSREISRIMWNTLMAGEGLFTTDSTWQSYFGGGKK